MIYYLTFTWWFNALPIFAVALGVIFFLAPRPCRSREKTHRPTELEQPTGDVADLEGQGIAVLDVVAEKPKGPRLLYLDHLKTILTGVVVIFHCTCAFSGFGVFAFNMWGSKNLDGDWYNDENKFLDTSFKRYFGDWFTSSNSAYFMALFFFISGFFTPSSLDRKGFYDFLKDKFKRYGIPVLVAFFVMMPAIIYVLLHIVHPSDVPWGYAGTWVCPSPVWFVSILILFNVLYACSNDGPLKISAPTAGILLGVGLILGLQMRLYRGGAMFMNVPGGGMEMFPQYILFFYSGTVAKRNDWLKSFVEWPKVTRRMMRILACVLLKLEWLAHALPEGAPDNLNEGVLNGVRGMVYSYVILELFSTFMNRELGPLMKRLSEAAYTVYIIHPLVVNAVLWSWTYIMRNCVKHTEMVLNYPPYPAFQTSGWGVEFVIVSPHYQELLWLGWLYTWALSTLIVWPLAYALRRLPYFDQVL